MGNAVNAPPGQNGDGDFAQVSTSVRSQPVSRVPEESARDSGDALLRQSAPGVQTGPRHADKGSVAFVAAVVAAIVLMGFRLTGFTVPAWQKSADELSRQAREARTEAFLASAPLDLKAVEPQERPQALASMKLDAPSRKAIGEASVPQASSADSVRLAWFTVWDTDDEDGDVVRIDSEGYSRTISLTKKPITIAVPVPADGVINVTGVRDGEGGGITVGAASQNSQVVLPIMSVGQVIGLHVRSR